MIFKSKTVSKSNGKPMKFLHRTFCADSGPFSGRWFHFGLMAAAFGIFYFFVLRFVRIWLVSMVVLPAAVSLDAGPESGLLLYYEPGSTGIYVYRLDVLQLASETDEVSVQGPVSMNAASGKPYYLFKGFGDQFFLFGGVLLMLMGQWRHVGWLFLFHAGVSTINAGLLLWGVTGTEPALQFMDFLIEYLMPATSMLWVVALYGSRSESSLR
jgi:hypothetical protein